MKQLSFYLITGLLTIFFFSCSTPQYFHDTSSLERQKELLKSRSGNVASDIFLGISTVCLSAALETDMGFEIHDQNFKKLNLINTSHDTMYINMLTDLFWDENDYCDFMDIRIPPQTKCKVMVPINANYNVYFSNTPESEDDELLEINTSETKNLLLIPGMTKLTDQEN